MSPSPVPGPIEYWNRATQRREIELVYGDALVRLLYIWGFGFWIAKKILARPWFSRMVGRYKSSWISRREIEPFIRKFNIPIHEYEPASYRSFNDFFIRRFKEGRRTFQSDPKKLAAPCEGRYLAFESIRFEQTYPVKGRDLRAEAILGRPEMADIFRDGPMLICRLCPVDYHRFHFPDDGEFLKSWNCHGPYHSVNPRALAAKSDIFSTNERRISLLKTKNFGVLAYIEVGALCVGRIVQSREQTGAFKRGEEKGYFLFGASTVILMGEKGKWLPDADLLEKTQHRIESCVKLGESVGRART